MVAEAPDRRSRARPPRGGRGPRWPDWGDRWARRTAYGWQMSCPAADLAVRLRGVTKRYGPVTAVDGIDLDIREGELLTLLGPSGSGKTTTLRMIAGFELPTEGTIHLGGVDVNTRPPFDRDVNTVFQDYALFPHMSVAD